MQNKTTIHCYNEHDMKYHEKILTQQNYRKIGDCYHCAIYMLNDHTVILERGDDI